MRSILVAIAAAALSCTQAFAQQTGDPVIHPGAQRFAHILLVDSGMFAQAIDAVQTMEAPAVRESYLEEPWALNLDKDKRARVVAYVDTIPTTLASALMAELPNIEAAAAAAYNKEFTPEELDQIIAYLDTEDGLAYIRAITGVTITTFTTTGRRPTTAETSAAVTPEQRAKAKAFNTSLGGQAMSRLAASGKAKTIMFEAVQAYPTPEKTDAIYAKIRADLCAIVGEPCPVPEL
jgi:hypothetical protein